MTCAYFFFETISDCLVRLPSATNSCHQPRLRMFICTISTGSHIVLCCQTVEILPIRSYLSRSRLYSVLFSTCLSEAPPFFLVADVQFTIFALFTLKWAFFFSSGILTIRLCGGKIGVRSSWNGKVFAFLDIIPWLFLHCLIMGFELLSVRSPFRAFHPWLWGYCSQDSKTIRSSLSTSLL